MIKALAGLFVDDEFLAAAILVVVALAAALALSGAAPWLVGALLAFALPAALAAGVMRTVRRVGTRRDQVLAGNAD